MDLWGIGSGEILLVLLVALIVFGPNRVVEIGRTLGKIMNTVKRASSDFTSQMTRELDIEDKKPPPQIKLKSPQTHQNTIAIKTTGPDNRLEAGGLITANE